VFRIKIKAIFKIYFFCVQGFVGEPWRERDHGGDPGVDGMIILKGIFRNWDWGYGLDRFGSR
jgi:hypothetical protein